METNQESTFRIISSQIQKEYKYKLAKRTAAQREYKILEIDSAFFEIREGMSIEIKYKSMVKNKIYWNFNFSMISHFFPCRRTLAISLVRTGMHRQGCTTNFGCLSPSRIERSKDCAIWKQKVRRIPCGMHARRQWRLPLQMDTSLMIWKNVTIFWKVEWIWRSE